MICMRIQTNRAKIVSLVSEFREQKMDGEYLIAPRPLQKSSLSFYIALCKVVEKSSNHQMLLKLSNKKVLTEQEWDTAVGEVKYSWEVK